jgi:HSP20 family protein
MAQKSKREGKEGKKTSNQNQALERGGYDKPRTGLARREVSAPGTWSVSPFSFMRRFTEEMDRLFEDFNFGQSFGREFGRLSSIQDSLWSPQVEVLERGNQLVVRADLPGLTKDDIDVNITDDAIVIQGERNQESEEKEEGYYRSERSYGSFYRSIPLPEGIDTDNAHATFRNGVLEITMPAPEQAEKRGKRLEVRDSPNEQESHTRAKAAGR